MVALCTKKAKGCSHFYKLLCAHDKKDGWDGLCNKMESDLTKLDQNYEFYRECFFNNVKKIMNIKYFNRIKQFMIRLYRNNLFLGHNFGSKTSPTECYACNNHRESRVELMLNCDITSKILQLMIRILKKAGCLSNGCKIDMFLFDRYPVNSIENITLMFTWKFIYNNKFTDCPLKEPMRD